MTAQAAIGFWKIVGLLLGTSRRRAQGRQLRQRQLLNNRSGRQATDWGSLAVILTFIFMALLHGIAAFVLATAVESSQGAAVESQGKLLVSHWFMDNVHAGNVSDESFAIEAKQISRDNGGNEAAIEQRLRNAVSDSGSANLVPRRDVEPGLEALGQSGRLAAVLGSVMLLWWFAMLVCQGEGLELDLQRRRHPMWEWLFSHPVGAGAVFFAEMLSPISANPTYWTAPLFVAILYGLAQGFGAGLVAGVAIGIPLTIAAACLGKSLEIAAILRLPIRSRGAVIGLLSWFGYASMVCMFFGLSLMPAVARGLSNWIDPSAAVSWSLLGLFLGLGPDGSFSFIRGVIFCWAATALILAASVTFSARSIRNGLSGAFAADSIPTRPGKRAKFGRDPLFRKEYLWFVRDRSAIVQALLIPITVAGFQLFNLRGLLRHAEDSWNYLAGAAIFFGTYFLWILGPKSLTSEGSALWMAMTWPRGLESVLKAKAWLWSMIASGLVFAMLLAGCWLFPGDIWKIALVGAGWFIFSRSMAEKSVTLVTITSESGEAEKIPAGRHWAAQLGMLTFAIGICTEQWSLAVVGIVYSWITAAAMWENFRARLPYLYDPWSERLPPPPTTMHAMVSISILVECAAVLSAVIVGFGGRSALGPALGIGYAVCAVAVSIGVTEFLSNRDVPPSRIWRWTDAGAEVEDRQSWLGTYVAANRDDLRWLAIAVGGGIVLALFAHIYLLAISQIPSVAQMLQESETQMQSVPGLAITYAIIAICFAPFAEEYLFRGLLFRTLDQQWGGWRALVGASAFFAIYHAPLAWVPVALVGASNCMLFKRSKRLAPAVLLHMTYNAIVTLWG